MENVPLADNDVTQAPDESWYDSLDGTTKPTVPEPGNEESGEDLAAWGIDPTKYDPYPLGSAKGDGGPAFDFYYEDDEEDESDFAPGYAAIRDPENPRRGVLWVPRWIVTVTDSAQQSLVLSWLLYWFEGMPSSALPKPRSKYSDGKFWWAGATNQKLTYYTGLTSAQVRYALGGLIEAGLVVRRDSKQECSVRKWYSDEANCTSYSAPDQDYLRISRRAVEARIIERLNAEKYDQAKGHLNLEVDDCVDEWFASDSQRIMSTALYWFDESGEQVPHTTLTPLLVELFDHKVLKALVYASLWGWWFTPSRKHQPLRRSLDKLAEEIGEATVRGRSRRNRDRISAALCDLESKGWISKTKKAYRSRGGSYLEIRLTGGEPLAKASRAMKAASDKRRDTKDPPRRKIPTETTTIAPAVPMRFAETRDSAVQELNALLQ